MNLQKLSTADLLEKKHILWKDSFVFPSPMALFTTKTNALPLCLIHGSFFEDRKNNGSFETKVGSWVFGTTWGTPFRVVFILGKLSGLT